MPITPIPTNSKSGGVSQVTNTETWKMGGTDAEDNREHKHHFKTVQVYQFDRQTTPPSGWFM